jgi:hypothetical protein
MLAASERQTNLWLISSDSLFLLLANDNHVMLKIGLLSFIDCAHSLPGASIELIVNTNCTPVTGRCRPTWTERIVPHTIAVVLIVAAAILLPATGFSQPPISITACGKIT